MAARTGGWLLSSLSSTYKHVIGYNYLPIGFLQTRNYAARKGTREKAKKKKVKVVIEKVGFIPHNLRKPKQTSKDTKKLIEKVILDDSNRTEPVDNVWLGKYHKLKIYPFEEAVQAHRETHHPTMYNLPNAPITVLIELNMQGVKKTRFVDTFTRIVCVPHAFDHNQSRKILAFCKTPEMQDIAKNAGAHFIGGKDLIKKIQTGEFSLKEYDIILSEPSILPDLLLIRGLIRKKFPSTKLGTLSSDMNMLVTKFLNGIEYTAQPHKLEKSYGTTNVMFGTLDMDTKQLEDNLAAIINDVNDVKPRRPGPFITRIRLRSPPSLEMFKVRLEQYLPKDAVIEKAEEEIEEGEGQEEAVIASH